MLHVKKLKTKSISHYIYKKQINQMMDTVIDAAVNAEVAEMDTDIAIDAAVDVEVAEMNAIAMIEAAVDAEVAEMDANAMIEANTEEDAMHHRP